MFRTRFAPSPTGPLHLGHAYSALLAHDTANAEAGEFLLRIEDIDRGRSRSRWENQIYDDLRWLGLWWPTPVMRQSYRMQDYSKALDQLWHMGLLYPCTCSRSDIQNALSAPQENVPQFGPDGVIYPGTCRENCSYESAFPEAHPRPKDVTLRLNIALAVHKASVLEHRITSGHQDWQHFASFQETGQSTIGQSGRVEFSANDLITQVGDFVVARKGMGTSYHLAVVLDDAAQGITHVIRGEDLFEATRIHVLLQSLLDLPKPVYHHHALVKDDAGKRLAKRDDARAISKYRSDGATPRDIRKMVGLPV